MYQQGATQATVRCKRRSGLAWAWTTHCLRFDETGSGSIHESYVVLRGLHARTRCCCVFAVFKFEHDTTEEKTGRSASRNSLSGTNAQLREPRSLHWCLSLIHAQVGINCAVFTGRGVYPTADAIDEAREMAKRIGAASIVGIGGGGAIDTAKAAARLHTSRYVHNGLVFGHVGIMAEATPPPSPAQTAALLLFVRHESHRFVCVPSPSCFAWFTESHYLASSAPQPMSARVR